MKKSISLIIFFIFSFFSLSPVLNVFANDEDLSYYTIFLKDEENLNEVLKELDSRHVQVVYQIPEIGLIQIYSTQNTLESMSSSFNTTIDTYNKSLRISDIETENQTLTAKSSVPSWASWENQWDMKQVTNNGESHKIFSGTKNVTVGIIDSGLDIQHPDLKDNIMAGSKNLVPQGGFRGQEPQETGDINLLDDIIGHGTHTAGQIAANGVVKGVAPGIGIRSYRVLGHKGVGESAWIIKAIIEAAKDNVDVINLSLGTYLINGSVSSPNGKSRKGVAEIKAYKKAIQFAKKQGCIVVGAAGNDALNMNDTKQVNDFMSKKFEKDGLSFKGKVLDVPAGLPNVVTVSSSDQLNQRSSFSNYGKHFTDISAPGGDYKLLMQYGEDEWKKNKLYLQEYVLSTGPNNGYFFTVGTSSAAPKVSATLALIIDKNNFKKQPNKAINFLYKYGVNKEENTYDNESFGKGILDVYKAVSN
ncbi:MULTISPECIES: S8 family peptidase [Bacillus cereus group]|uniref:S8 family peptidase n=1 Tax=Bacillus cereus group TaxID=86661 RepID=UPI00065BB4BE|nr:MULTISPECIES: S8 family serine peptidase [Bacillus cereus group]KMQ07664.1 peptidase S8 [Bacillus cereus]MBR9743751.1 peptidase S8 [Bacillus cereus]MCU5222870.1 S8 family serine peptidase [Bacillus tropicus]MDA1648536.1 S8 family serine peptidase [Bacillus cereus group sp. TH160LC]MDA1798932.1 S8 family serine peptidase [Bacillus cereus group sp. BY6-1LC]